MMRRRVVGRPVARVARVAVGTAVVAGTAGAVHHHQEQKYANQAAQQQAAAAPAEPEVVYVQAPPEQQQIAAPAGTDLNSQLMQLSQLHNSGVLSDEEFAQAKQKLLNG
jgi:Short C-terminal domain